MEQNQFLYKEYEECFKQLRFYDDRQSNFVKYVMTISSTIGTLLLALYRFFKNDINIYLMYQSLICFVVFAAISIILLSMIRNRLYFTITARQINAIRKYFLENECKNFNDNQMYLSTNFPAFKLFSTQTLMILGVAFISSLFLGASVFSFLKFHDIKYLFIMALVISFITLVIEILFCFIYLTKQGKKSSDTAIHGKKYSNK